MKTETSENVKGKGPPIESIDGVALSIGCPVYKMPNSAWNKEMPTVGKVISIDLTLRNVRIRWKSGGESVCCPDGKYGGWGIYGTVDGTASALSKMYEKDANDRRRDAERRKSEADKATRFAESCRKWKP